MAAQYLTQADVSDYGIDLINFSQRAAAEAVAPQIENLAEQNRQLQVRLARESRARMDQQVEAAIPNYRELDQQPEWHRWLLGIDSLSGRVRQNLLDEAKASGDAARCIAFFRSFFSRASQPQFSRPWGGASSPSGKVYTRAEISKLYDQHRRGAYRGREAAWQQQEADIFRAQKEGRVIGGEPLSGRMGMGK